MTFGQLIKKYRDDNGLGQADVGKLLGIKDVRSRAQYVSNLERGVSRCSPDMALKLAKALKIPVKEIFAALDSAQRSALSKALGL